MVKGQIIMTARRKLAILSAGALAMMSFSAVMPAELITAAAEEAETSGTWGTNIKWAYDSTTETLTISGRGAMNDAPDGMGFPWMQYRTKVKKVVIQKGVTSIAQNALRSFSEMTELSLPSTMKLIDINGVNSCSKLTGVNIPEGVQRIGRYAFQGCSGITELVLPGSLTELTEDDHDLFSACENLKKVTLSDGITLIPESMFASCSKLETVIIPDSVTEIQKGAFFRMQVTAECSDSGERGENRKRSIL